MEMGQKKEHDGGIGWKWGQCWVCGDTEGCQGNVFIAHTPSKEKLDAHMQCTHVMRNFAPGPGANGALGFLTGTSRFSSHSAVSWEIFGVSTWQPNASL